MATKEHKRTAKGLIESLEGRVHSGPPILDTEISSAREFLRQNDFSPTSHYFSRLGQVQHRLLSRSGQGLAQPGKRNYGGEAADTWLQVQCSFDHIIVSTCYDGVFNLRQGRIKVSHRFNQAGRLDFVEAKLLRSLEPCLNGEIRKLLLIKDYQSLRKEWHVAEAFILPVLPRELIFLFEDLFRCPRNEVLAWLGNIGHRLAADVATDLEARARNGGFPASQSSPNPNQLPLHALREDTVAWPILEKAASLEISVELTSANTAEVRTVRQ